MTLNLYETSKTIRISFLIYVFLSCFLYADSKSKETENNITSIISVDILDRVFVDQKPEIKEYSNVLHMPRGCNGSLQFSINTNHSGLYEVEVLTPKTQKGHANLKNIKVYHLLAVPVEGNSQHKGTYPDKEPPKEWFQYLIRKAPFNISEVLVETENLDLQAGYYYSILVDIEVPQDAQIGEYNGVLTLKTEGEQVAKKDFTVIVHKAVVGQNIDFYFSHWLWPEPENLTNSESIPQWWSEEHWQLLKKAGLKLREFYTNSLRTPTIFGENSLVEVTQISKGKYNFEYSKFDRWIETFKPMGFKLFEGEHVAGRGVTPFNVYAKNEADGLKLKIFHRNSDREEYMNFLGIFFEDINKHLKEKNWIDCYVQHLMDEPASYDSYETLTKLFKAHTSEIKNLDAIHSWGQDPTPFSPNADIFVFYAGLLDNNRELGKMRQANGKENWIYWFCSPIPPQGPNTSLDRPLPCARLYPWLAYLLDARGMLHWGANVYRGADPYVSSIGPWPKPNPRYPGHPPGDNWFYYPTERGLTGSIRLIALRDGIVDLALLKKLEKHNNKYSGEIVNSIVRAFNDYEIGPEKYYEARKSLLNMLDKH